ncbi:NAD-dependent epimerase/dehydratase family protein [Lactiplantibacillus daowaiensis]|uniref:NAD-dependent epimerase/dehydratase family protein n=1 Tax=Lactiplantibacillus daowaiensis TaxID=2559918 RepID=A0ABW1RYS6_9LACO|nr:NAD-dependent epimerase/dehydratase family protein [Lactiplantibacillus daowaiensis]
MKPLVLVTGGNGFLAEHLLQRLLTAGYPVRATLRTLAKADQVKQALAAQHVAHLDRLTFVTADLTRDADWPVAMQGVGIVLSVAAPVFVNGETVDNTVTQAAKEGTLRILKAAEQAGVKRVVMTGNLGAVGFSRLDHSRPVTEADWTDPDQPGLSLYETSKLIAEQSAWTYMQQSASSMTLTTVNAGAMLGPALDQHVSGSFGLVDRLLKGQATPNLGVNIVDVRDVADLQLRAMTDPAAAGERFLAVADTGVTTQQMIQLIRTKRPTLAPQLPQHLIPKAVVSLIAPFNATVREARLMMRLNHQVSNQKAQRLLGWQPQYTSDDTILAAVDQLTQK